MLGLRILHKLIIVNTLASLGGESRRGVGGLSEDQINILHSTPSRITKEAEWPRISDLSVTSWGLPPTKSPGEREPRPN